MKHFTRPNKESVGFLTIMLIGIFGMLSASVLANQTPAGATPVGDEACLTCHDDVGEAFKLTSHGSAATMIPGMTCESCHGPGSVHVDESDPEAIINPAKLGQFDDTPTCLGCHNTDTFDDWTFSHHNNADVSCAGCHNIHAENETRIEDNIQDMCLGCHTDIRAAMFMPSRHPIREGMVDCLDCHNVHGGQADMTLENSRRELCFSCHPEKEGPFVFEHAPASEDCMVCHTPHGSVADNLLIQTEPTLCLNCHAMHFHATIEGVEGEFTPPHATDRTSLSTADAWKSGMLTKCTQCHTAIHGTDLPSQAISTSGSALTR